jgi:hypothetical protein
MDFLRRCPQFLAFLAKSFTQRFRKSYRIPSATYSQSAPPAPSRGFTLSIVGQPQRPAIGVPDESPGLPRQHQGVRKMSTRSQIDAHSRNAQKSTGPRTVQGQAPSRQDALKSPIDTPFFVIPGEDPAALVALTRQFYHDCQPQTLIERLLVDNIIHDAWLLRRFARIDAEMLNAEMLDARIPIHTIDDTRSAPAKTLAAQAFLNTSESQCRLQGRINDTSRNQILAIKELERLQAQRAPLKPPVQSPQPVATKSVTSKNGFVSQKPVSGIQ